MSVIAAIERLEETSPLAVELAESVSFATMIDRALLRAARLELVPAADAGVEADLWFSSLVQSRTSDGIVLDPEVADALRRRMSAARAEAIWRFTCEKHEWLPPSLRLEEEIAYLSVSQQIGAREQLEDRLRSVLASMVSGERAGLAQWAVRALSMFPSAVLDMPEARMLEAGARLRLGENVDISEEETSLPPWLSWLAPESLERVPLDLELRDDELEIRATTDDRPMRIPATNPLFLGVSWDVGEGNRETRRITFRRDETITMPVGRGEVRLETIAGEQYALRERGYASPRLREELVDFSREMQRHADVIGRGEEVQQVLDLTELHSTLAITGEMGLGKTAFLCELIRVAERRGIPVVSHFFRFGDLRLESIDAAERSLAAQIAVRFGLSERVLDVRLADVLQHLRFHASRPSRLLILLDDIDQARNAERANVANALREMFPSVPDFVRVVASSTAPQVEAEYVHSLQRPTQRMLFEYLEQKRRPDLIETLPHQAQTFGEAELMTRIRSRELPSASASVRVLLDADPYLRDFVIALAVSLQPLPLALFPGLADLSHPVADLIRFEGEEFEICNSVGRALILGLSTDTAGAHRNLVQYLDTTARAYPSVDHYYLLNAPWHLIQASDHAAARDLCLSFEFMAEKIEKLGVDALIADLLMVFQWTTPTGGDTVVLRALQQNAAALEASPQDIAAILRSELTAANVASSRVGLPPLPLEPELVRSADLSRRDVRRHDGPIRGSDVRWTEDANAVQSSLQTQPTWMTWSDDGTAKLWASDDRDPATLDHGAPVTAFEVKQPYAISADANGFLHLWDLRERTRSARIAAHDRRVGGLLVDVVRGRIVSWSANDPIRQWLWDRSANTILPLSELAGHSSAIAACSLMPDGRLLVSASRGGTCRLWDANTLQQIGTVALSGPAIGMAHHWDASSRMVITAKRTLDVVRVAQSSLTIESKPIETGHDLTVSGVAIAPDGKAAVTWSADQTIRIWDVPIPSKPRRILRGHRAAVTACRFIDRSMIVSGDADGVAIVWNVDDGSVVSRLDAHRLAIRTITNDAGTILTAGDDGVPLRWYVTGRVTTDFSPLHRVAECVVIPRDDLTVLTTDGESKIEIIEGGATQEIRLSEPILATTRSRAVVCSADARSAYVIPFETLGTRAVALPRVGIVTACAVDDNGLVAVGTRTGAVFVETSEGAWRSLGTHHSEIMAITFGSLFVALSVEGTMSVWRLERAELVHRFVAHRSRVLAFASAGGVAVTGSADGTLRLWDLKSGTVKTIEAAHEDAITHCRFGRNIVVTASLDGTVRVFDYQLARRLAVCRGHRGRIRGIAIAFDEGVLYTCSDDRTIRRWDAESGLQTGIAYGTAPFRCISWNQGHVVAGDDAGNLWTVKEGRTAPAENVQPRVYICHARDDTEFAERLTVDLVEAGVSVSATSMAAAVDDATAVLVIFSEALLESTYARPEVEEALRARKEIIVLLHGLNRFDVTSRYPELASFPSYQERDWSDEARRAGFIRALVDTIRKP